MQGAGNRSARRIYVRPLDIYVNADVSKHEQDAPLRISVSLGENNCRVRRELVYGVIKDCFFVRLGMQYVTLGQH
jgi:hypothetical protein